MYGCIIFYFENMQGKQKRILALSPNVNNAQFNVTEVGPGQYELPSTQDRDKTSFNYAEVPFGNISDVHYLHQYRDLNTNNRTKNQRFVPGPGSYNTID